MSIVPPDSTRWVLIAAVGRELDAPVVSADRDLTHEKIKQVVDVEEYRD